MFGSIAKALFGSSNDRAVRSMRRTVQQINLLENEVSGLSDSELRAKTVEFRNKLNDGFDLEDLLPEAFAVVREAAKRTLGQRPFDVQLMGGIVLHSGRIAEMKTGEGKTLVATLPVYLNALTGKGVHVVTVNDYLAKRDAEWMSQIYRFLGLSVGIIMHGLNDEQRRAAYAADITYATNNELGFDYLRDNMKFRREEMVQRPFNYAIVDEVDSILIDEARTPLIISGIAQDSSELYRAVNAIIPKLTENDFEKDEKFRTVAFTETGTLHTEQLLREAGLLLDGGLYDVQNVALVHHTNQALRAHALFHRDDQYIVKDDKVIIIDEFTGRMMEGRRFSDGLHQALEAKEMVTIQQENQTLASITFQNFFRLYPKLGGMTGTAITEAAEFDEIYRLQVVEMPTNRKVSRQDEDDEVYRTATEKYQAIATEIVDARKRGQPVLVGTTTIEKSELVSRLLTEQNIPHAVLNARFHEQEASIIAQAGRSGAVTIATNMAGRGTDIKLGGNLEMALAAELAKLSEDASEAERQKIIDSVSAEIEADKEKALAAGGLYVIGTERHESRRIDNQLRGRSGRQGDPGKSKFFLCLEDDLMRIFGAERMQGMLQKLGLQDGEAIVHPWINKAIERAQEKVEQQNFEVRKNLLRYDDVMNDQRKAIYGQRRDIMGSADVADLVHDMREDTIEQLVNRCVANHNDPDSWDIKGLHTEAMRLLNLDLPFAEWVQEKNFNKEALSEKLYDESSRLMARKAAEYGPDVMRQVEKSLLLQILDQVWKDHLLALDHLKQGINLRSYGQKDPLNEYKRDAFGLFESMLETLREQVTSVLSHVALRMTTPVPAAHETAQNITESHPESAPVSSPKVSSSQSPAINTAAFYGQDVNRNAPCPCGSGKKYKHCHGMIPNAANG